MNYLAHAYLSYGIPEITVGNMISDYVKGRKILDYPHAIQQGIRLHRAIDQYTDTHAVTRLAKQLFQPHYRLYSSAFVDVVYDHFLAADTAEFSDKSLMEFSLQTYQHLDPFASQFPEKFARMFPYMKQQNWLYNYQFRWGLKNSLAGLVRRAAFLDDSETAFRIVEENYEALRQCYQAFIPDVKVFAERTLQDLLPPR
jgi:acyl carrier protein phosphodiesterase